MAINKYEAIHDELQKKIDAGDLTMEDAQKVDDLAYEKYADTYLESADDDEDLVEELAEKVKDGSVKLSAEDRKCIKELIKSSEKKEDDEDDDDKKDDSEEDSEDKQNDDAGASDEE